MTYWAWLDIAPLVVVFAGAVGLLAALVWPVDVAP